MPFFKGSNQKVPACYIRIDIAHFVKAVTKWKSLNHVANKVKEFYIRSVCLLVLATDINQIEELLFKIMIVALTEMEG